MSNGEIGLGLNFDANIEPKNQNFKQGGKDNSETEYQLKRR